MSDLIVDYGVFTPINLEASDKGDQFKWNVICTTVVSKSHAAGDFEITEEHLHDAVKNFKQRSAGKVPIKFEHHDKNAPNFDPNVGSPAQGYIHDMRVAGNQIYGLCEFKEPAKTYVLDEKYQWFSPGLLLNSLDRKSGKPVGMRIREVSLVTDPHLYDMPSVKASNEERNENTLTEDKVNDKTKEDSMSKELEQQIAELRNQLKASELKVAELTLENKNKLAEVQIQLDNKTKEYEVLIKDSVDGEVDMVFNTYKDSRKLEEKDKEHLKTLRLANVTSFRAMFPVKQPASQTTTRAAIQRPAYLSRDLSNDSREETVKEVKLSQKQLHEKYISEGMENTAAALRAAKESK